MSKKRFDDTPFGGKFKVLGNRMFPDCSSLIAPTYELNKVEICKVIYNNPATIIEWSDGTKTVSKCAPNDLYNTTTGLTLCILKKLASGDEIRRVFSDWYSDSGDNTHITISDVRKKHKL